MWTDICPGASPRLPETGRRGEVNKIATKKDLNVHKVRMCYSSVITQQMFTDKLSLEHVSGEGLRAEQLSAEDNFKGSH